MSPKETTKTTFERPFSDRWVLKHVRESPIRVALTQLKVWAPGSHKKLLRKRGVLDLAIH